MNQTAQRSKMRLDSKAPSSAAVAAMIGPSVAVGAPENGENVVQRLRRRIRETRRLGIDVRLEWLDGGQCDWCVIGKKIVVFLDSGQTASEQLAQLEEIVAKIFSAAKHSA